MDGKQKAIDLMKKISIELSRAQLEALEKVIQTFLIHTPAKGLESKATAFRVFRVYEAKIRKKMYSTKQKFKIVLDISEAQAINEMIRQLCCIAFDPYSETTLNRVSALIDQQTV